MSLSGTHTKKRCYAATVFLAICCIKGLMDQCDRGWSERLPSHPCFNHFVTTYCLLLTFCKNWFKTNRLGVPEACLQQKKINIQKHQSGTLETTISQYKVFKILQSLVKSFDKTFLENICTASATVLLWHPHWPQTITSWKTALQKQETNLNT